MKKKGVQNMKKDAVILKSSKYGLQLKLDPDIPFDELKELILNKFTESEKFFQDSHFAVTFEGRDLTDEEEFSIVEAINENTSVSVVCIMEEEEVRVDLVEEEEEPEELTEEPMVPEFNPNNAFLRYDSLTEDEVLISDENLVIMGNVPESATVTAAGSIIVLGSLLGKAWAGSGGKEDAFVFALDLHPDSLRIGGVVLSKEDEGFFRRRKKIPRAARISGGMVILQDVIV